MIPKKLILSGLQAKKSAFQRPMSDSDYDYYSSDSYDDYEEVTIQKKHYQLLGFECFFDVKDNNVLIKTLRGNNLDYTLQKYYTYQRLKLYFRSNNFGSYFKYHTVEININYTIKLGNKLFPNLEISLKDWILLRDFSHLKKMCFTNNQTDFSLEIIKGENDTYEIQVSLDSSQINNIKKSLTQIDFHLKKQSQIEKQRQKVFNFLDTTAQTLSNPVKFFHIFEQFDTNFSARWLTIDKGIKLYESRNLEHILYTQQKFGLYSHYGHQQCDHDFWTREHKFKIGRYHPNFIQYQQQSKIKEIEKYNFYDSNSQLLDLTSFFTLKNDFTAYLKLAETTIFPKKYFDDIPEVFVEDLLDSLISYIDNNTNSNLRSHIDSFLNKPQQPRPTLFQESLEDQVPYNLICPITGEIMREPVLATDGHTYEKSAINFWFESGRASSPKTNKEISTTLIPNYNLKSLIEDYQSKQTVQDKFRNGLSTDIDLLNLIFRKYPDPFLWINERTGYLAVYNELTQEMITDFQIPLKEKEKITEVGLLPNNNILIQINNNEILKLDLANLTLTDYYC